jgi:hypothetical protein
MVPTHTHHRLPKRRAALDTALRQVKGSWRRSICSWSAHTVSPGGWDSGRRDLGLSPERGSVCPSAWCFAGESPTSTLGRHLTVSAVQRRSGPCGVLRDTSRGVFGALDSRGAARTCSLRGHVQPCSSGGFRGQPPAQPFPRMGRWNRPGGALREVPAVVASTPRNEVAHKRDYATNPENDSAPMPLGWPGIRADRDRPSSAPPLVSRSALPSVRVHRPHLVVTSRVETKPMSIRVVQQMPLVVACVVISDGRSISCHTRSQGVSTTSPESSGFAISITTLPAVMRSNSSTSPAGTSTTRSTTCFAPPGPRRMRLGALVGLERLLPSAPRSVFARVSLGMKDFQPCGGGCLTLSAAHAVHLHHRHAAAANADVTVTPREQGDSVAGKGQHVDGSRQSVR